MKLGVLSFMFSSKKWVWGVAVLVVLAGILSELVPFLQGLLVSKGIIPHSASALTYLIVAVGLALLLDGFARAFLSILANNIGFSASQKLRTNFFGKLIRQPYEFFVNKRSGDMVFRANIFIYSIGQSLSKNLANFTIGVSRVVVILVYMFTLNWLFALCLLGIYSIAIMFSIIHSKLTYKIGKAYKELELHRNSLILQNLDNMDTFLAYNDNFSYLKHYNRINLIYRKARNRYHIAKHLFYPCIDFFVSLGTVVLYFLVSEHSLSALALGVAVAMLTYANRMIMPIQFVATGLAELVGTQSTTAKVLGFVKKGQKKNKVALKSGAVDISCVSISGQDTATGATFSGVNLEIPFGTHIAIKGAYGNGKTAFAEMILGLRNCQSGKISFNGVDVGDIRRSSLHKLISLAGDDVGVFENTLFENVHFAKRGAKPKEVLLAIKKAFLMDFAQSLVHGVHTKLKPVNLTETQKQQIAFARILLKNTPVLIVDEFDRDFDQTLKAKFFRTLKAFAKNKTLIYVCQTPPKELEFDRVIDFKQFK